MERISAQEPAASRLRASDAERDAALRALAAHFADGRLDQAEFDRRSDAALAARTRGELAAQFTDLPSLEAAADADGARSDLARMRRKGRPRALNRPGGLLRRLPPLPIVTVLLAAYLALAVTLAVAGAGPGLPPFPLLGVIFILARRHRRGHRGTGPWM